MLVSSHEQIYCCFLNVRQEQPVAAYSSLDNYCSALPLIAISSWSSASAALPGASFCPSYLMYLLL